MIGLGQTSNLQTSFSLIPSRKMRSLIQLRQAALANSMENFGYVFLKSLEGLFIDRMDQNEEITTKYLNDKDFQTAVGKKLLKKFMTR